MDKKRGNTALIVVAIALIVVVIILIVVDIALGDDKNGKKPQSSTSSTSNTVVDTKTTTDTKTTDTNTTKTTTTDDKKTEKTTTDTKEKTETKETTSTETKEKADILKEEAATKEEVKKIDESKGKIYDVSMEVKPGYTTKVPIINLTTKAATRINAEVEKKYREANGYYIVYYYYMYIGMISVILDYRYNSGAHTYEVYNVSSETGKEMTNEDLLTKLKVSKDDFLARAKNAYKAKFEEIHKDIDKNSEAYKKALDKTLKNAENALNEAMFINLEAEFAVYAKIAQVSGASDIYSLVEFK